MELDGGKISVLDGYSPAKIFETRLLEVKQHEKQELSAERAQVLFEVFDEVLPQLGIFRNVLKMVRDEIFEAVYSDQYTSSKETRTPYNTATNVITDRKEEDRTFIQRIPYFTLVQRVYAERHEEADNLRDEIEILEKRLADKTQQHEETAAVVASQSTEIAELKDEIVQALQNVEDSEVEIEKLKLDLTELTEDTDRERRNLEFQKRKLQERVATLEKETEFLNQYKNGYDALQDAFNAKIEEDKYTSRKSRRSVLANKKNHLLTNFDAAKKLERQLLEVQNQTIEEFESFLEAHKSELQCKVLRDTAEGALLDREYDEEEMELERLDTQLSTAQDHFQQTITALNTELDMIRQHRDAIQQQMEQQQAEKTRSTGEAAKTPSRARSVAFKEPGDSSSLEGGGYRYGEEKATSTSGKESALSVTDNFVNVDLLSSEMDPFVPQESILSKYSVMIYTTTNQRKTWHELKDAKFCTSCGEKTVLCPHKVSGEKVIMLPHNCSHIKLSRPGVRIPMERTHKAGLQPHPPPTLKLSSTLLESGELPAGDPAGKRIRSRYSVLEKDNEQHIFHGDSVTPGIADSAPPSASQMGKTQHSQDQQMSTFVPLWDDFKGRTSLTRSIPKPLDMKRTLSIIGQFYAHVLWQDEHALEDEPIVGVLNGFYNYMADRYILQDVMYLCAYDFISALTDYSALNKAVQIFAQVLVGNLDATVFRYLLVISDLIDRVDWQYVEDFKAFATAIYPFLNEDDIDQLHLGYTSFSENKVSKALVCEYLMYIILKYREPRFQDIESKLLQRPGKELGLMNEKEFSEAVDAMSPLANEKLRHRLFAEAQAHCSEGAKVAIMRLSHIASYLLLQQVAPLLRQKMAEKVEDSRILTSSNQGQATISEGPSGQKSDETDDIMTAAKLRNLAKNIDRRAQNRSMRRIEGNLRYDMTGMSDELETQSSFMRMNSAGGDAEGDSLEE
ncbi:uncharacterized protein LOC110977099 isoform X2 [Acanthaster planci]|uniref:Uncharacterized protein LOC110977099 isoform X2 n=1 Tax=Acanthaster planci TaxID=133434 RepID=A0A8B7Y259_ACAPL|nr:uncharacterized protein LOC110977099 isoform X2 [Acanthaster planci]XP_022086612.1 uncharacterized protein LOC110977099 isoform X2 [Acanthaster planci]